MLKAWSLVLVLSMFSLKSYAIDLISDQQVTLYYSLSFDAGYDKTSKSNYGLRFDRDMIQLGDGIKISQLRSKSAILNLKVNEYGIKALELNGVNYAWDEYAYHANEAETDTNSENEDEQKKKSKPLTHYINKAPTGVLIGVAIGVIALVDSLSSSK